MTAQDYISSGLLEAYVLGSLNLTEHEQVAGAMCRFPEVAREVSRLEADLLRAAEAIAVPPPPGLEEKIWAAIQASGPQVHSEKSSAFVEPERDVIASQPATKIIALDGERGSQKKFGWLQAAALVLLFVSVAANMILLSGRKEQEQEMTAMRAQMQERQKEEQNMAVQLARYREEAELMSRPGVTPVPMLSTQSGQAMAATIYWEKERGEAYVSVQKLPPPPEGMQYQLWAIADGKPVDIGMLDNAIAAKGGMQKVPKAVMAGQAFAVSLERAGGSPTPTGDKIYLLGKLPA